MVIAAEVRSRQVGLTRQWLRATDRRPILVLAPAGTGLNALRLYRRRWDIESSLFYQWSIDKGRPRPKTINSHVVQFLAHVIAKSIGQLALLVIQAGRPSTDEDVAAKLTASHRTRLAVRNAALAD